MKVIDVHVHMFPDAVSGEYLDHYIEISGQSLLCEDPSLEGLKAEYRGHEVLDYVILGQWESTRKFDSKHLTLAAESDLYYARHYFYTYHDWLSRLQSDHEDVVCFGNVHPDDPAMMAELDRMLTESRLKGLKLVPCMQFYRLHDRRLFPAYERAAAQGVPVILHTGGDPIPGREIYGHPRDVDEVASAFPKLTIVMAHLGAPFFEETREVLAKHENVYTDLSFAIDYEEVMKFARRHGMPEVARMSREDFRAGLSAYITQFGYERVLYGSDFPYARPRDALDGVLELNIKDDAKEMILWKNAKEVLGL
jgi:predicted TIM-barrel fold metal-dependent hydrolase